MTGNEMNQSVYGEGDRQGRGELIEFKLDQFGEGITAYNPSIPFPDGDKTIMLVRLELATSEVSTVAAFDCETREILADAPIFNNLQDPYFMGEFSDSQGEKWKVIGGVRISTDVNGQVTNWRDEFFRYKGSISELRNDGSEPVPFMVAQPQQKDTRIVLLQSGKIGVFPRPWGDDFGGRGRVGYFETDNLDTISSDLKKFYDNKDPNTLIEGLFEEEEWGGGNQLLIQADGKIKVIGHRARYVDDKKDYEAVSFRFDPDTRQAGPVSVIATADAFGEITPKKNNMNKIVYPSGVVPIDDGSGDRWLYCGVGDVKIGRVRIRDPLAFTKSIDYLLAA